MSYYAFLLTSNISFCVYQLTLATYYWFSLDQAQKVIFIKNIHLIFNTLFELWIQFACHEGMHQQGI